MIYAYAQLLTCTRSVTIPAYLYGFKTQVIK